MADIFDTIQTEAPETSQAKGDIFDQAASTPADANLGNLQFWAKHPFINALMVNPVAQMYKSVTPLLDAGAKFMGLPPAEPNNPLAKAINDYQVPPGMPAMASIPGDIAGGVVKGGMASLAGGGNPLVGYPMIAGAEAYGKGQPVVPAMAQGAIQGGEQMLGGKVGATLASKIPMGSFSRFAPNVGTATGMGGVSALAAPEGEKVRAGAAGAAFGLMSPMSPVGASKQMTLEEHNNLVSKEAAKFRSVINPDKGDINKVEVKSGKSIDDSMENAVRKGLVIEKSSDGSKLDTTMARAQLDNNNAPIYDQINQVLSSNPAKQFNLDDIAAQANKSFDDPSSPLYEKNAKLAAAAKGKIQDEIDAEIARHGQNVDGTTLNTIKQGMWGKSYNPLEPNANDGARQIGHVAKESIEKAYPNADIKSLNQQLGDNLTLTTLLERAHGRGIQAGKIGKYAAQGIGALTAHASGIPGAELGGAWFAGKASSMMNDPTSITKGIAGRVGNVQITNQNAQGTVNPGTSNPNNVNPPNPSSMSGVNPVGSIPPTGQQGFTTGVPNSVKALGAAGAIGIGSALNPVNAQAQNSQTQDLGKLIINKDVKEPERLNLPGPQYTQKEELSGKFDGNVSIDHKTGGKVVGYGFDFKGMAAPYIPQAVKDGRRAMTQPEATDIFNKVYPMATAIATKFAGDRWGSLSQYQQKALTDMAYQMGSRGLNGFHKLQAAIQGGHFNTAAREILDSNYGRKDAPNRAMRNAALIRA